MSWDYYMPMALAAMLCWIAGGIAAYVHKRLIALFFLIVGVVIFTAFIAGLWYGLQRPPLRTMGETRLWYAFFLACAGIFVYYRWRFRWLPICTSLIASIFALTNIIKPEIHSVTLMPALQSPWFIPHVTVYILSYAMLGIATIAAITQLIKLKKGTADAELYGLIDNTVYIGFGFLVLGLISGAVWAKEAWGHYWAWDPKETWAFITAVAYLVCIHLRLNTQYTRIVLYMLPIAFILLMVAWIGVNYLPAAQTSVHVYS